MHLLKKIFGVIFCALHLAIAPNFAALAQDTESALKNLPQPAISGAALTQDLLKLEEGYDHTAKYAVNCTIYALDYRFLSLTVTVLSTYKISTCNPDLFAATTSVSVKAQLATYQTIDRVTPIGPHVQMMDRNTSTVSNPYLAIGMLNFSKIASAYIGPLDIFRNFHNWRTLRNRITIYTPVNMAENVDYTWLPGSKIFTLVTKDNEVFIMSHFTPNGSGIAVSGIEEAAANLGHYLNLPAGWRYEVQTIDKILTVRRQEDIGQTSRRVFDEYSNAYIELDQKIK